MPRARLAVAKAGSKAWGAGIDRVGPSILRRLALTENTFGAIAKSTGTYPKLVSTINTKYGVRSPDEITEIRYKSVSDRLKAYYKAIRETPARHFKPEEKKRLLEKHNGILLKVAKKWWKSYLIRSRFKGNWNDFVQSIKIYAFEKLDYYKPGTRGFEGKIKKPSSWMFGSAELFCLDSFWREKRKLKSQKNKKAMPVDSKGLAMAQTGKVTAVRGASPALSDLQWIPFAVHSLLKKLNLDANTVAKRGFGDIKKQILEIANARATGLTEREKQIIQMRLNGLTTREIKASHGLSHQMVSYIETKAAKKMRWQLRAAKIKVVSKLKAG